MRGVELWEIGAATADQVPTRLPLRPSPIGPNRWTGVRTLAYTNIIKRGRAIGRTAQPLLPYSKLGTHRRSDRRLRGDLSSSRSAAGPRPEPEGRAALSLFLLKPCSP